MLEIYSYVRGYIKVALAENKTNRKKSRNPERTNLRNLANIDMPSTKTSVNICELIISIEGIEHF